MQSINRMGLQSKLLPVAMYCILVASAHAGAQTTTCQIVTVQAQKSLQGRKFGQNGVGTLFSSPSATNARVNVLVPAHVVFSADQLRVRCGWRTLPARMVGISPTLDLAVLETAAVPELKPMFQFPAKQKPKSLPKGRLWETVRVVFPQPHSEAQPQELRSLAQIVSGGESPLLGFKSAIQLQTTAVRPGVSGSPLFWVDKNAKAPQIPAGILTKSLIDDHQAIAIRIEDIWSSLPDLLQGRDPWLSSRSDRPTLRLDMRTARSGAELIVQKTLVYPGGELHELCNATTSVDNSEWIPIGGSDWADDGGSDWADDAGGEQRPRRAGVYTSFPTLDGRSLYGVYKRIRQCNNEGLRLLDGRTLLGLVDRSSGTYLKTDGIEDLFAVALRYGKNLNAALDQYGVFAGSTSDYAVFCNERVFGKDLTLSILGSRPGRTSLRGTDHPLTYMFDSHNLRQDRRSAFLTGLICNDSRTRIDVRSEDPKSTLVYSLRLEPNLITGRIMIGQCDIEIDSRKNTKKYYWSAFTTDPKAVIRISWSPNSTTIFKLSVLHVAPECRHPFDGEQLWLHNDKLTLDFATPTAQGDTQPKNSGQVNPESSVHCPHYGVQNGQKVCLDKVALTVNLRMLMDWKMDGVMAEPSRFEMKIIDITTKQTTTTVNSSGRRTQNSSSDRRSMDITYQGLSLNLSNYNGQAILSQKLTSSLQLNTDVEFLKGDWAAYERGEPIELTIPDAALEQWFAPLADYMKSSVNQMFAAMYPDAFLDAQISQLKLPRSTRITIQGPNLSFTAEQWEIEMTTRAYVH